MLCFTFCTSSAVLVRADTVSQLTLTIKCETSGCCLLVLSVYNFSLDASQGILMDNSASPFSLQGLCSGLYGVLERAGMYQDGDSVVECALGGGSALTLVEMALELRLNPRPIRSIAELKQDWSSRRSKQWLLRFVPAAFKFLRFMLVLAKPTTVAQTVPSIGVMAALTKEQRLELRRNGLVPHRESPLANRVVLAQERIREEVTQGCYPTLADQFCKSRYYNNPNGPRDISLSCTAVVVLAGLYARLYARWPSAEKLTTRVKDVALQMRVSVTELLTVAQDFNRKPRKVLLWNIWWRVAKIVYKREHVASPIPGALRDICPVYGIWHAYKACVSALYKDFPPFFSLPGV